MAGRDTHAPSFKNRIHLRAAITTNYTVFPIALDEESELCAALLTSSAHSLRGGVGRGRAGGVDVDECEFLFIGEGGSVIFRPFTSLLWEV